MSTQRSTQRSTLVAAAVTLALSGQAAPVLAAQSTSGTEIEEVVVTGIRSSLRQSIETKREAVGVVDAITSEDVGKFPDKNLAEALQRVPGIVVNREFGEGERVNLRGTASNLTRTLLNGHALATADWFILDQLNTTRSFNYLMLPSDVIGKVAVYKSPQADFEEGGIGGTIDVATRSPLQLEPSTMYLSAQGAYTEMSKDFDPQVSGLYSWRDADSTFGFLIAGIYQERNLRRDGVEVLGYDQRNVGGQNLFVPSLIGSALFEQDRKRTGGNIGIQFAPSDQVDVNVTGLWSRFEADNTNQNYLAWVSRALDGEGQPDPPVPAGTEPCPRTGTLTNTTVAGGTVVAGRVASSQGRNPANNVLRGPGTCGFGVVYDAIDRFATATTRNIDADVNVRPMEGLQLHFKVGYTDAEGNTDAQPFVEFGAPAVLDYDLRGKSPQVHFVPNGAGVAVDPTNPASTQFIFSSLHQILNDDSEKYVYVDALKDLEMGAMKSIKVGVKHTDHDRRLLFNATTYGGFHVPINATPSTRFAGGQTPGDFLDDISAPGTLSRYWDVDFNAVENILFPNLSGGGASSTRRRASRSARRRGPVTRWRTSRAIAGAVTSACATCAPSRSRAARRTARTARRRTRSAASTRSMSSATTATCCRARTLRTT